MALVVDYDYYTNNYLGTKVPLSSFEFYSNKAYNILLNNISLGRIAGYEETTNVKNAICGIIDYLYVNTNVEKEYNVSSESVDGYIISYNSNKTTSQDAQNIYNIAFEYLGTTGLVSSNWGC